MAAGTGQAAGWAAGADAVLFTHWTMPYDAAGLRVSIAVDFELSRAADDAS
jgi:hypothetical protein